MQRCARWPRWLLLLVLLGCRDNPPSTQQQRAAVSVVQNLERDYSALVAQFNADSAKVRMLLMLAPT